MSEPALPTPQLIRRRTFAPIWLLPIVALLVGVWLVWRSLLDTGPGITIAFDSGEGITVNQTVVQHKGIVVGTVRSMSANADFSGVEVGVELDKKLAKNLGGLPANTSFWLVQAQVSLAGVSGLNTLLSGNYIGMALPAHPEVAAEHFVALKSPPPLPVSVPGLHIQLTTDKRGSVEVGTPILSRQITIGQVTTVNLAENGTAVQIGAHIQPQYAYLIRKDTRFWNSSGLRMEAGLGGLHMETDSLLSLLSGGISVSLPNLDTELSHNGDQFTLYEDFAAAENSIIALVEFPSAQGLTQGVTKVIYKGMPVGRLVTLSYNHDTDTITGRFGIDPRFGQFITDKTRFWLIKPQLSIAGISGLDALLTGAYLTFYTAPGGEPVNNHHFSAANGPDPTDYSDPGLHLKLTVSSGKSVNEGAPVYFNDFIVGNVQSRSLEGTQSVLHILIDEQYRHLINRSTRFWNTSGINFSANVQKGISLQTSPLASVLVGGVAFYTPSTEARAVDNGYSFELALNEEAVLQSRGSRFGLQLTLDADDAGGVSVGAPILYRELPIGRIHSVNRRTDGDGVQIGIQIEREHRELIGSHTRFYRSSPLELNISAAGANLRTGPLAQWLTGGIAVDHFSQEPGRLAESGERYRLYSNRDAADMAGLNIRLKLHSAEGLSIGSELRYQGLAIGEITRMRFARDMQSVEAEAALRPDAASLLTNHTQFWKVEPSLGLARTHHLNSLLGSYLQLYPQPGAAARSFTVLEREPLTRHAAQGLNITLIAERLGSLRPGDPVLYRQVKVGEVLGNELSNDGKHVLVYLNIWPEQQSLVRSNSRFWLASGVRVEAGLFKGVTVAADSLETIIAGGVSFASPEPQAGPVAADSRFVLLDKEPDWKATKAQTGNRFTQQQQSETE